LNCCKKQMKCEHLQLKNWTMDQILREDDIVKRGEVLNRLVELADKLRDPLCNFDGFVAITSALHSNAIHRMDQTWARCVSPLPQPEVFDPSHHCKMLRDVTKPPSKKTTLSNFILPRYSLMNVSLTLTLTLVLSLGLTLNLNPHSSPSLNPNPTSPGPGPGPNPNPNPDHNPHPHPEHTTHRLDRYNRKKWQDSKKYTEGACRLLAKVSHLYDKTKQDKTR
jgi:hypothetical protein